MTDQGKTKEELIRELEDLRKRFHEVVSSEAELRAAKEALRDSETRFRSVAQAAVDAIVSANVDDEIIFWNKAASAIFGYSEAEALGKPVSMLIPERLKHVHREGVLNYLKTGVPALIGRTVELPALRKGGFEFPIELALSAWTAKGETFFTGIIRDISARKEAESQLQQRTEEARQRSEELESLIQMVAHDLKSPIVTIVGLTRLLKKELRSMPFEGHREEILRQLEVSGTSLETFLTDLLDALAAEGAVPEKSAVPVDRLIQGVIDRHRERLKERSIELEAEIPPSIPPVLGDLRRLTQVLDNLVGNAVRYMGDASEPRICVRVTHSSDIVTISVSDNGVGIAPEFHEKIFERFFRAPGSGDAGGTGLGLPIVKKIVDHHDGTVWVESEEGKGSTFSFSLPAYKSSCVTGSIESEDRIGAAVDV